MNKFKIKDRGFILHHGKIVPCRVIELTIRQHLTESGKTVTRVYYRAEVMDKCPSQRYHVDLRPELIFATRKELIDSL